MIKEWDKKNHTSLEKPSSGNTRKKIDGDNKYICLMLKN